MKRLSLALLVLSACQSTTTTPVVELAGPNSMALAGRNLLVANTGTALLRAVNLASSPRGYQRGPNPIFPLAIPTAPYPRALGAYTEPSDQSTAPLAFALSSATSQMTVLTTVGLTRLGEVAVPDTSLAVAVPKPAADGKVVAVLAAAQGPTGILAAASFDPSLVSNPAGLAQVTVSTKVSLGLSVPQALVAVPGSSELVLVGDRRTADDGAGRAGGLAVVNLSTGEVQRYDVGGPVLALSVDQAPGSPTFGDLVYGVLDSEACVPPAKPCSGVFAFRLSSRSLVAPLANPIPVPGNARGVAIGGPNVTVTLPNGTTTVSPVMVTSSNGNVYLIDGGKARLIDVTGADATATVTSDVNAGIGNLSLTRGKLQTQTVNVTYEGALPGLGSRAGTLAGTDLSDNRDFAALGVLVGDLVVFEGAAVPAGKIDCSAEVAAVAQGHLTLAAVDPCAPAKPTYSVRAKVGNYLVTGTVDGVLGRVEKGGSFRYVGSYFWAADTLDAASAALAFTVSAANPNRGDQSAIAVTSGIDPFTLPVTNLSMPGAVAYDPGLGFFYVAFEGGNVVLELNPAALRTSDASSGIAKF